MLIQSEKVIEHLKNALKQENIRSEINLIITNIKKDEKAYAAERKRHRETEKYKKDNCWGY